MTTLTPVVFQGYRQKDYFIATQGPLPHTVEDFWRMVWEWKCHSIVMLTELQEREQVSCDQLNRRDRWPQWLCYSKATKVSSMSISHRHKFSLSQRYLEKNVNLSENQSLKVKHHFYFIRTSAASTGPQRTLSPMEITQWSWRETLCVTPSVYGTWYSPLYR